MTTAIIECCRVEVHWIHLRNTDRPSARENREMSRVKWRIFVFPHLPDRDLLCHRRRSKRTTCHLVICCTEFFEPWRRCLPISLLVFRILCMPIRRRSILLKSLRIERDRRRLEITTLEREQTTFVYCIIPCRR